MKHTTIILACMLLAIPIMSAQVRYNPAIAGVNKYTALGLEFMSLSSSYYKVNSLGLTSNFQIDKINTSFQLTASDGNHMYPYLFSIGVVPELQVIENMNIRMGVNYNISTVNFNHITIYSHSFSMGTLIYNNSSLFAGASVNNLFSFDRVNGETINHDRSFLNFEGGVILGENTEGSLLFSPMVAYQHFGRGRNIEVGAKSAYKHFNLGAKYSVVYYNMKGIGANIGFQVNNIRFGAYYHSYYTSDLRQYGVHLNVFLKDSEKQTDFNRKYHRLYF